MKRILKALGLSVFVFTFFIACNEEKKEENATKQFDANLPIESPEYKKLQIEALNEKLKENPNNARDLNSKSKLFLDLEMYDSALSSIDKAIQLDSSNENYYFVQSRAFKGQNRVGEAFIAAKNAENRFIKDPDFFSYLGKLYFITKDYGAAFHYLEIAEDLSPFHTETFFLKGLMYLELGDTIKGIKFLELAIEQVPDDSDIFNVMASVYNNMGQPEMAIEYLKTGLRMNDQDPFIHYNFGVTMNNLGDPDSAMYYFAMSTRLDSTFYLGHYNMGILEFNKEDCEDALNYFSKTVREKDDFERVQAYMGYCFEKSGMNNEALKAYEKAIEKEPDNNDLKVARDRVKSKLDFERQSS